MTAGSGSLPRIPTTVPTSLLRSKPSDDGGRWRQLQLGGDRRELSVLIEAPLPLLTALDDGHGFGAPEYYHAITVCIFPDPSAWLNFMSKSERLMTPTAHVLDRELNVGMGRVDDPSPWRHVRRGADSSGLRGHGGLALSRSSGARGRR